MIGGEQMMQQVAYSFKPWFVCPAILLTKPGTVNSHSKTTASASANRKILVREERFGDVINYCSPSDSGDTADGLIPCSVLERVTAQQAAQGDEIGFDDKTNNACARRFGA
jgi:hypothetical protein